MAEKEWRQIELVKQEQEYGCVPACLAMITGREYWDIAQTFGNNFSKEGIEIEKAYEWLADEGFSVVVKRVEWFTHRNFGREELLKVFAPVHLVNYKTAVDRDDHAVVMDYFGNVWCSTDHTPDLRTVWQVTDVAGIWMETI